MNDLLLVFPPISVNERYNRNIGKVGGLQPPLGIASLAAYVRENGFTVDILDAVAQEYSNEDILNFIQENKPAVVGISSLTSTFNRAILCAEEIKKKFPSVLVIIGGHHATIFSKVVAGNNSCFDLCVFGEGELTLLEILYKYKQAQYNYREFLNNFGILEKIDGIAFRKKDEIVVTQKREMIPCLDDLPLPARDLLDVTKYQPLPNQYKSLPLFHLVVSRGCPFNCSYCSANGVFGRKLRMRSPKKIVEEIEYLVQKYGAKDISFWDDAFTTNKKWVLELCQLIKQYEIKVNWTAYGHVNTVDKNMLQIMRDAGCWNMFFGFESGNQNLLDTVNKNISLEQIRTVNNWCKEVGMEVRASFMIALPQETPQMALQTINFAIELNPDYAQFCITTPFPGTQLFEDAKKFGSLDLDFDKYNVWQPVFVPTGYKDRNEILEMEKVAVRKFYFRFGYIIGRLSKVRSFSDIKRYFKGLRTVIGFAEAREK